MPVLSDANYRGDRSATHRFRNYQLHISLSMAGVFSCIYTGTLIYICIYIIHTLDVYAYIWEVLCICIISRRWRQRYRSGKREFTISDWLLITMSVAQSGNQRTSRSSQSVQYMVSFSLIDGCTGIYSCRWLLSNRLQWLTACACGLTVRNIKGQKDARREG